MIDAMGVCDGQVTPSDSFVDHGEDGTPCCQLGLDARDHGGCGVVP